MLRPVALLCEFLSKLQNAVRVFRKTRVSVFEVLTDPIARNALGTANSMLPQRRQR